MTIADELNLNREIETIEHECMLNIVFTGTLINKIAYRYFKKQNITDVQFNVLMELRYAGPRRLSQIELSKRLVVNKADMTGIIDRMEKAGLVRRIHHTEDRRVKLVVMMKKGARIVERLEPAYLQAVGRLMSVVSRRQMEELIKGLETVRKSIPKDLLP